MMSERDKRAVLIAGIAAAAFLALQSWVLPAWDRVQAEREGLEVRERTFLRFREAIASRADREAERALLEGQLQTVEAGLLSGETPAIASAALRTRVQQLAAAHGLEVVSTQFLPEQPLSGDYLEVPLGVRLRGRIDELVGFLQASGSGAATLGVTELSVRGLNNPEKRLDVNLTVVGVLPQPGGEADGTP